MKNPLSKIILPKSRSAMFLIVTLIGASILNLFQLKPEMKRIQDAKKLVPHQIIGYQFTGLDKELKNISHVGYFTDSDLATDEDAAKLFSYAQYILAPAILVPESSDHYFSLFVYEKESEMLKKMKELNLEGFRGNSYGMVLARKKNP